MKRIILSTIPGDFNPDKDIPLGPWCFIGRENVYSDWAELKLEDPYKSTEEMVQAAEESVLIANGLLPALSRQLNEANGCSYSTDFWRNILMTWLLTLIQTTRERYSRISDLIGRYGDEECVVDIADSQNVVWSFADTGDFLERGVFGTEYNKWLFSSILEARLPEKWSVTKSALDPGSTQQRYSGIRKSFNIKDIGRKVLAWFRMGQGRIYGFSPAEALLFSVYLKLLPLKNKKCMEHVLGNSSVIKPDLDYDFYIQKTLPVYFLKLKEVLPPIGLKAPKKGGIKCGSFFNFDDSAKVKFALARERGEILVGVQHGGNYGNAKVFSIAGESEYKLDAFVTWGWTKQEDYSGNMIPLPSPYLSKIRDRYKKRNNDLIFVGTRVHMFTYRLDSIPQPAEQLNYLKQKVLFIENLDKSVYGCLKYRPYFDTVSNKVERPYMYGKFPDLKLCDGSLHSKIIKCKLLVLDHPGTTLNVALAGNIPIICYWDKFSNAMCKQSIPYFDALEKAGIIFRDGLSAANKVNEIWDDVLGWWRLPENQKARQQWCNQYARTSCTWRRDWAKAFWKMERCISHEYTVN